MRQRWPLPMGVSRSMMRVEMFARVVLEVEPLVRVERRQVVEEDLLATSSGGSPLIASTLRRAK